MRPPARITPLVVRRQSGRHSFNTTALARFGMWLALIVTAPVIVTLAYAWASQ